MHMHIISIYDLQENVGLTFSIIICNYAYYACASHTQNGASSLMAASEKGYVEVVETLLQHGARVDLQNKVCFCILYLKSVLHIMQTGYYNMEQE